VQIFRIMEPYLKGGISHATINGHRFHLRVKDPTKENFLWIDGRMLLVLNNVAADLMSAIIESMWKFGQGSSDATELIKNYVVEQMYAKYGMRFTLSSGRVTRDRIRRDLDSVFGMIMNIAEGRCLIESGMDLHEVAIERWAAPARMDLALTYRCNLNCSHCYTWAGPNGEHKGLDTGEWEKIIEHLWEIGVPNLVFTGGEPTLRDDLVRLVRKAEQFVTGLVTNGTRLTELAPQLQEASIDYVQVTLESADANTHNSMVGADFNAFEATVNGIKKALSLGMFVVTNTTLIEQNVHGFNDLLKFGRDIGLRNMACNTLICSGRGIAAQKASGLPVDDLKRALESAINKSHELGIHLDWFSPTCYLHLNPLELGFGAKGCSAAAYNMTVQPDGTMLPCQSWPQTVGHILNDPWEKIWTHPVCVKLRQHGFASEHKSCVECVHNEVCGGGCPLEKKEGGQ
jgi:radical SAM protein with 4Fe4S-binding SPASM domain